MSGAIDLAKKPFGLASIGTSPAKAVSWIDRGIFRRLVNIQSIYGVCPMIILLMILVVLAAIFIADRAITRYNSIARPRRAPDASGRESASAKRAVRSTRRPACDLTAIK